MYFSAQWALSTGADAMHATNDDQILGVNIYEGAYTRVPVSELKIGPFVLRKGGTKLVPVETKHCFACA
jgi:hypothetical protein